MKEKAKRKGKGDNPPLTGKTVVLGVTASIAAYKAAELVSRLRQGGAEVLTVMTPDALEFIRPLTFLTLSGNPVFTEIFAEVKEFNPAHISLARRADMVAVAPATADFIGKVAAGLAGDLLTSVVMATTAPVLIAPAMNEGMYNNPIVRENIEKLKGLGYRFIGPEKGFLACGYEGAGRLAALGEIIREIETALSV